MADFEETLKIIVKTQDETSNVVRKIDGEMAKLNERQRQVTTESVKASKALGGLGDAFGMIIRRSPAFLAADFVARVAGFNNLMGAFNATMNKAADATREFIQQAAGFDVEGAKMEARLDKIRAQFADIQAAIRKREGIVDFGADVKLGQYAPQVVIPENIRTLEEAQAEIERTRAKLIRLNQTTHEGRERFLEQNDLLQRLNDTLATMSNRAQDAADQQKNLAEQTKKAEAEQRKLEAMSRSWRQSSSIAGTSQPGSGYSMEWAKAAISAAQVAIEEGRALVASKQHADTVKELEASSEKRMRNLRFEMRVWGGIKEAVQSVGEAMVANLRTADETQKTIAATGLRGGFERINEGLQVQQRLWEDIAATIQYNVGAAIGAILTNIHDAEDVMKNLLRALQQGINMAIGQAASGFLFGSAKGNVFSGGDVTPFARGGVVSSPTMFPMRSGTGLMGEAGPEAIVPLRRGPDGSLGVESHGGGTSVALTINVGSLDPRGAADVIMANLNTIADGLAGAIAKGSNRNLRSAVAGAR